MKKIKIIFISFFVVFLFLIAGLIIFIKTFDINRYKPQIIKILKESTQKEISLGDLSLNFSWMQGIILSIKDISLLEEKDPAFEYSLKIDSALLDVDMLAFLKTRQITVSRVQIVSPKVSVIRKKFSIQTSQAQGQSDLLKNSLPEDVVVKKAGTAIAMPAFMIKTIIVSDGIISFVDKNFPQDLKVDINKFDLEIKNFFLDKPFKIQASLALFSAQKNISFQSQALLDLKTNRIRFDDAILEADLASFDVQQMKRNIPQLAVVPVDDKIEGKVLFNINQLIVGQEGVIVLSSSGELKDGKIKVVPLGIPLDRMMAKVDITEADIILKELVMNLGSGRIKVVSRVTDYIKNQKYSFDAALEALEISELLAPYQLPLKIDGKIVGNLKGEGQGFTPEALNVLKAQGRIVAQEAKLVDFNLLRFVLDKISVIPDLAQKIEAQLPDNYKNKMVRKDTIFKKVDAVLEIKEGKLWIAPLIVDADDFVLETQGNMDFNQNAQFQFDFYINEELSREMVKSVEQLSYLLEEDNKIHIPLVSYQGPVAKMMVYPDMGELGKKIITTGAKQELKKAIFKALKIESNSESQEENSKDENSDSGALENKNNENSEEILINNVLDAIFK